MTIAIINKKPLLALKVKCLTFKVINSVAYKVIKITYDNIRCMHISLFHTTPKSARFNTYLWTKEYKVPTKLPSQLQWLYITSIPNFLHKCKRCIEVLHGKLIMGTMFPSDRENAIGNSAVNELLILDHKSLPLI